MSYDLFHHYIRNDMDSIKLLGVNLMLTDGIEKNPYARAMSKRIIGSYQIRNGEQKKGISLLKEAVRYFEKKEDYLSCCEIYTDIGNGFLLLGEYAMAKKAYETSLELGPYSSDPTSVFNGLIGLGRTWVFLGDTIQALECFREYRSESIKLQKYEAAADASALIGELLLKTGDKRQGRKMLRETLTLSKKSGSKIHLSHAYTNMGIYYFELGNTDSSLICFTEALRLRKSLNNRRHVVESYYNLGDFYAAMGDIPEAEKNYLISIRLAKENDLVQDQADAYEALLLLHENGSEALIERYTTVRDSLKLVLEDRNMHETNLISLALKSLNQPKVAGTNKTDNSWLLLFFLIVIGGIISLIILRRLT